MGNQVVVYNFVHLDLPEIPVEIVMYLLFLAVGFAGGLLVSHSILTRRLEQRLAQPVAAPEPPKVAVNVNVNDELVARYLATFNLVAIPRDALQGLEVIRHTRH